MSVWASHQLPKGLLAAVLSNGPGRWVGKSRPTTQKGGCPRSHFQWERNQTEEILGVCVLYFLFLSPSIPFFLFFFFLSYLSKPQNQDCLREDGRAAGSPAVRWWVNRLSPCYSTPSIQSSPINWKCGGDLLTEFRFLLLNEDCITNANTWLSSSKQPGEPSYPPACVSALRRQDQDHNLLCTMLNVVPGSSGAYKMLLHDKNKNGPLWEIL